MAWYWWVLIIWALFIVGSAIFQASKPKWKRNDPRERKKAVLELENQNIIADMAKNDEDPNVRKTAVKKLELNYKNILEEISKNDKERAVQKAAKNRLKELELEKINELNDQDALAEIAKNEKDGEIRKAAVCRLEDQNTLAWIVKNEKNSNVRLEAVRNLRNQELLIEIAKNDENPKVRGEAVYQLKDQEAIAWVAKNEKDLEVRRETITKLDPSKWQDLLSDIARNDDSRLIRTAAFAAQLSREIMNHVTLTLEDEKLQAERITVLTRLGLQAIPEIESAIRHGTKYGSSISEFENAGLLCEAIGKIGGPRATEILSQFATQESNIAEYRYIRSGAKKGLAYLDESQPTAKT